MTDKKAKPEQVKDDELDEAVGGAAGAPDASNELARRGFNPQPEPPAITNILRGGRRGR
ncbi:MAG: hypothetical protein RIM84_17925 [Alphaproteobacteria bacterium]